MDISPWPLAVLTVLVMLLAAVGALPRWSGLLHLVALPPLGLLADLRILFVHAPSYTLFALGLVLSMIVRVTVVALILGGLKQPAFRQSFFFYTVSLPACIAAASAYAAGLTTTFYVVFWFALFVTVAVLVLLSPTLWSQASFLASLKRGLRVGTVLAYLGLLLGLGALAELGGPVAWFLLVPVSAALTYGVAYLLTRDVGLKLPRRLIGAATAGSLAFLAAVVVLGPGERVDEWPEVQEPRDGSLFIMGGIDSASGLGVVFEVNPPLLGYTCEQTYYFSYAGPGDGQPQNNASCPIRTGAVYGPEDTLRPLDQQALFFQQQVLELEPPVTVLAHSQAIWVAWRALVEGRALGVRHLVLVGTLPQSPVAYPPDRDTGPGHVLGDAILLVATLADEASATSFHPASPLARDVFADPFAVEELMAQPVPEEIRVLNLTSSLDLPLKPEGWERDGATNVCVPVLHPHIPWSRNAIEIVDRFLDSKAEDECPLWQRAIGPLSLPLVAPPSHAY